MSVEPFLQNTVGTPLLLSKVSLCLIRLDFNRELRIISNFFGVGLSTACVALPEAPWTTLQQSTSPFQYCRTGLQLIVDIFLFDLGLPQCLSVINGSHIPNTDSLLHHKTSSITISLCSCSSMLTLSQSRQHCTGYKCMYLTKCLFAAIVLYKLYVLYI